MDKESKYMKKVRTRFAPSPTGYLHIGGLRTALYGYLYSKMNDGDFILRIEDTDTARYVDGSVQIIYDTMRDSGIMYDDIDIGIEWPFELIGGKENLIISEKDLNLMSFKEYTDLEKR